MKRRAAIGLIGICFLWLGMHLPQDNQNGKIPEGAVSSQAPLPAAAPVTNVRFAGVRSSRYGIRPFPEPRGWHNAMLTLSGAFPGSTPCSIWILGVKGKERVCHLSFPTDGRRHRYISFEPEDGNERYLDHFDRAGVKVFLQVEPASADVTLLIDLVLDRYKHHACVAGFGVDVEWLRETDHPGRGARVDDETARLWESRIKSHNPRYRLFLKHWDRRWMPRTYRGDIIFVDDSQMLGDFNGMLKEFVGYWADYFRPNTVFFQVGYKSDRTWWGTLKNPPLHIGEAVARRIEQPCGIFWVDFTLRDVIPSPLLSTNTDLQTPGADSKFEKPR